jgi:hypothetical protein
VSKIKEQHFSLIHFKDFKPTQSEWDLGIERLYPSHGKLYVLGEMVWPEIRS